MKGVLPHITQVLTEAKGALDVTLIVQELFKRGVLDDDGPRTRHHAYTRLLMDIRNYGEDSSFRRVGRGVFCLATQVQRSDTGGEEFQFGTALAGTELPGGRNCGNCDYISFEGVNELTLQSGYCENNTKSRRHYCLAVAQPCPFWKRRDPGKVAQQKRRQRELQLKVDIFNNAHKGKRPT